MFEESISTTRGLFQDELLQEQQLRDDPKNHEELHFTITAGSVMSNY